MKYIQSFENINISLLNHSKYNIGDIVKIDKNSSFSTHNNIEGELFKILSVDYIDNKWYYKIKWLLSDRTLSWIIEKVIQIASESDIEDFYIRKNTEKYNI